MRWRGRGLTQEEEGSIQRRCTEVLAGAGGALLLLLETSSCSAAPRDLQTDELTKGKRGRLSVYSKGRRLRFSEADVWDHVQPGININLLKTGQFQKSTKNRGFDIA